MKYNTKVYTYYWLIKKRSPSSNFYVTTKVLVSQLHSFPQKMLIQTLAEEVETMVMEKYSLDDRDKSSRTTWLQICNSRTERFTKQWTKFEKLCFELFSETKAADTFFCSRCQTNSCEAIWVSVTRNVSVITKSGIFGVSGSKLKKPMPQKMSIKRNMLVA